MLELNNMVDVLLVIFLDTYILLLEKIIMVINQNYIGILMHLGLSRISASTVFGNPLRDNHDITYHLDLPYIYE